MPQLITIEIAGLDDVLAKLNDTRDVISRETSQGLLDAAYETIMPEVEDRSTTVWNVRTGFYSSSWFAREIAMDTIEIGNEADYWVPLETGWTTQAGTFIESPGVLYPAVFESLDSFVEAFMSWLRNRVNP